MKTGWSPLPLVLKIIFVILAFRLMGALLSLQDIYNNGYEFFGRIIYELYAVNAQFFICIAFPLIILFGIYQRYAKIWIVATIYFMALFINSLMSILIAEEILAKALIIMKDVFTIPEGVNEEQFHAILLIAIIMSFVLKALFNLALMILFLVKRKYFHIIREENPVE
ncbi:MAG: hypothetical protein PHR81_02295 [Bacteroidales bacterium]|jgi:hypothetical protein|nr:hypothetical protein [Bacteroidales bacterium]MDD4213620.1 hypothetical protein [Bacteroidales bacterium]